MVPFLLIIIRVIFAQQATQFRVENNRILDSSNRECFFHGLNVIYKSPPYFPITDHFDANLSFSDEDMQLLNSLGQNVIRLGVEWPGVAPTKDSINTTYINNAATLISSAYTKYNITTLVDCHQDTISQAMCGEGTPLWATQPESWNFPQPVAQPYNTDNSHIPSKRDCDRYAWYEYLKSYATSTQFQRMYTNYNNLRDAFADYWGLLASHFKNVPGIIGFDLLNEPWPGDIYNHSTLVNPGVADKQNLEPFYDAIAEKIYGNDSGRMIFFESAWYNLNAVTLEVGFSAVPGGSKYSNQSVLSFHYYDPPCTGNATQYFYNRSSDAVSLNATSFLTEFGIGGSMQAMSSTMDHCDEYLQSWIGWEYKPYAGSLPDGTCTGCGYGVFRKNGDMNQVVVKAISRTYVQKVAGNTKSVNFDWENNGKFTLVYEINTDIVEPTLIYISLEYWYPNGYDVQISPNGVVRDTKAYGNFFEIYNSRDNTFNGQTVTVIIQPK